jgi:hypothetical protein
MKLAPASIALAVLGTLACGGSSDAFRSTVQQRATFDMGCQQVTVQNIGGDSYGALGCGKKASYTCVCMYSVMGSCTKPACTLDGADQNKPAQ